MNKNRNKRNLFNNKGITLIALVITIVILLILAAVTINLTLGENGLFKIARDGMENYTDAQNKELADIENIVDKIGQYRWK